MPLKYFKHKKTYDGVLESSFMFGMQVNSFVKTILLTIILHKYQNLPKHLDQLTVICNSTPIGQSAVLSPLGINDGKCNIFFNFYIEQGTGTQFI